MSTGIPHPPAHGSITSTPDSSISSDTTLVSSTTIAALSIEARRLAHRPAPRQFQLNPAEGLEQLVDRRAQDDAADVS